MNASKPDHARTNPVARLTKYPAVSPAIGYVHLPCQETHVMAELSSTHTTSFVSPRRAYMTGRPGCPLPPGPLAGCPFRKNYRGSGPGSCPGGRRRGPRGCGRGGGGWVGGAEWGAAPQSHPPAGTDAP